MTTAQLMDRVGAHNKRILSFSPWTTLDNRTKAHYGGVRQRGAPLPYAVRPFAGLSRQSRLLHYPEFIPSNGAIPIIENNIVNRHSVRKLRTFGLILRCPLNVGISTIRH